MPPQLEVEIFARVAAAPGSISLLVGGQYGRIEYGGLPVDSAYRFIAGQPDSWSTGCLLRDRVTKIVTAACQLHLSWLTEFSLIGKFAL